MKSATQKFRWNLEDDRTPNTLNSIFLKKHQAAWNGFIKKMVDTGDIVTGSKEAPI